MSCYFPSLLTDAAFPLFVPTEQFCDVGLIQRREVAMLILQPKRPMYFCFWGIEQQKQTVVVFNAKAVRFTPSAFSATAHDVQTALDCTESCQPKWNITYRTHPAESSSACSQAFHRRAS